MSVKEKQTIHENAAKVGQAADILTDPRKVSDPAMVHLELETWMLTEQRTQYDLQIGIHKH